jgi:hypothetical protein
LNFHFAAQAWTHSLPAEKEGKACALAVRTRALVHPDRPHGLTDPAGLRPPSRPSSSDLNTAYSTTVSCQSCAYYALFRHCFALLMYYFLVLGFTAFAWWQPP